MSVVARRQGKGHLILVCSNVVREVIWSFERVGLR